MKRNLYMQKVFSTGRVTVWYLTVQGNNPLPFFICRGSVLSLGLRALSHTLSKARNPKVIEPPLSN